MAENLYNPPRSDVSTLTQSGNKLSLLQIYFSLQGRVNRKTYWLLLILPMFMLGFISAILVPYFPDYYWIDSLITLLVLWPNIAVQVKRWHDRDKSGWWVLIGLIPIVGFIWALIENGFLAGDPSWNQYGEPQDF